MRKFRLRVATAICLGLVTQGSRALEIETIYYAPGAFIPSIGTAGDRPDSAAGQGDLESIVRAAADVWEALIGDQHRLTLHFGWFNTTGRSNSAYHIAGAWSGTPLREVSGSLAFNNSEDSYSMFLDPTPRVSEEFTLVERGFGDYGGGWIEDSRRLAAVTDDARARNDLYTAAIHEIGHALGLTSSAAFDGETIDGDIDLTQAGYVGSEVPVIATHLDTQSSLLSAQARPIGERRGVTQVDLLAVCEISGFQECSTDLAPADYAGDLNGDNRVDAADYLAWRAEYAAEDSLMAETDAQAVFEVWRNNYGRVVEPPPAASGAAPEPTTAVLALLTLTAAAASTLRAG